jgi:diguanylate cyclase (GGDEF)-like protein
VDKHRIYARIYPWTVIAAAVVALVALGVAGKFYWSYAVTFLTAACILSEWLVIKLPYGDKLTLSIIFVLLAILFEADQTPHLTRAIGALQVIGIGSLVGYSLLHRLSPGGKAPPVRSAFYVAHYIWAASLAGLTYISIATYVPNFLLDSFHLPAVAGYTVVFSLVSSALAGQLNAHILKGEKLPKADLVYTIFMAPIALIVYYFFESRDLSLRSLLILAIPLIGVLATFRLYVNVDTTYGEISQLYEISQEFVAAMSQEEIVRKVVSSIAQAALQLVPQLDAALVYVHNDQANEYLLASESGDGRAPRVILPGQGWLGRIAVNGTGTIENDLSQVDLAHAQELDWPPKTALLVHPMFAQEVQIGMLMLVRYKKGFTPQEFRLVGIVANQAGIHLHNAQMYERSQQLADKDRMLGVLNQAAFTQQAQVLLSRARLANHPVALLYPDIDDFRVVNNTFGHPTGDKVLIGIASIMQQVVGEAGIVGRSAGEEFFILLPDAQDQEALQVADEIRAQVERSVFVSDDQRDVYVTLSIGVAVFPRDAGDFASLKKQADRAAYLAKRLGKNRVCLYQDRQELVEPPNAEPETASSGLAQTESLVQVTEL